MKDTLYLESDAGGEHFTRELSAVNLLPYSSFDAAECAQRCAVGKALEKAFYASHGRGHS